MSPHGAWTAKQGQLSCIILKEKDKTERTSKAERKLLEPEQHYAPFVFANIKNLTSVLSQQKYKQSPKKAVKHRSALYAQQRTDKLIQTRTNRYFLNFFGKKKKKICVMRKKTHIYIAPKIPQCLQVSPKDLKFQSSISHFFIVFDPLLFSHKT